MGEWYWILAIVVGALAVLFGLSILFYRQFFKRFYDIVLSGIALIAISPVLLILIVAGAVAMGGNPYFVQLRPGKIDKKTGKEKIFKLIKFRSMTNKKDAEGNLLPDAKRLTKYGKILRKTSLDELPELFNIFIGDMSIVGPRPWLVKYLDYYTDFERRRQFVRPGLTGLSQVSGRNSVTWEKRFELDGYYAENVSLFFDIKILFLTVKKVFIREGIEFIEGHQSIMDYFASHKEAEQKKEKENE
ncbi:MAG: sugar transferase [Clostridia bacterium]|nr:sugar transferase [Clostridia bacterium]